MSGQQQALAGLTLDDVLSNQKSFYHSQSYKKNRKPWKAFKETFLLKRYGSAWASAIGVPTSDITLPNPNSRIFTPFGRRNSLKHFESISNDDSTHHPHMADQPNNDDNVDDVPAAFPSPSLAAKGTFSRRSSTRYSSSEATFTAGDPTEPAPAGGALLRPQLSRRNSSGMTIGSEPYRKGRVVTFRDNFDDEDQDDEDSLRPDGSRTLSAREAVAAQEAAEAAAAGEVVDGGEEEGEAQPAMMSLMDLLEETDREMGFEGSRYILSDDEDFDEDEEDEGGDDMEYTCSVCMVRHKANAISRCGHSYCRMCSRELMVGKGNCPLCNNFVVEILDIF